MKPPAARSPDGARLRRLAGDPNTAGSAGTAVVLLLHGGNEGTDRRRVPIYWLPVARTISLAPALSRSPAVVAVYQLWNAVKGWNGDGAPVRDAGWALHELSRHHPGRPIVLVGHSMGGRAGAAALEQPGVAGLVGLAPWLPPGEPVPDLHDRRLLLMHGDADRSVPVDDTRRWFDRAAPAATPDTVRFLPVPGGGHAMLGRLPLWHRLTVRGVEWVTAGVRPGV